MIVYKITNLINEKVYIGITTRNLTQRWQGHLKAFRNGDMRPLYVAMRKYGLDNFKIEKIDSTDSYQELLEKEKYYVKMYNSRESGYNLTDGGDSNPMEDEDVKMRHDLKMRTSEVRKKISETMKKRAKSGILFSEEHKRKLSIAALGNHNFGSGDTRSIGCYCILEDGTRLEFHSYLDAGKWWYNTYKPFGDIYSSATYQRKIKLSIKGKKITFSQPSKSDYKIITNIKWYKL